MHKDAIIASIDTLPTLPTSVANLGRLIASPDATAKDFEDVIKPDPALTANLLRLANSAYFGLRREVTSVRQAITLLGSKRVFELAASAGFSQVIPPTLRGYEIKSSDFWRHCVATAVLTETLAKELGLAQPGMLFTAGLLHDIGKLAVGTFCRVHPDVVARLDAPLATCEESVLGVAHPAVGAEMAQRWDLPQAVVWGARWHHAPHLVPDAVDGSLVDLVHLGNAVAAALGYGAASAEIHPDVQDRIGFTEDMIPDLGAMTQEAIDQLCALLQ